MYPELFVFVCLFFFGGGGSIKFIIGMENFYVPGSSKLLTFKFQPHKMVKHTQTIRRQIADKLWMSLAILWDWCLKG